MIFTPGKGVIKHHVGGSIGSDCSVTIALEENKADE